MKKSERFLLVHTAGQNVAWFLPEEREAAEKEFCRRYDEGEEVTLSAEKVLLVVDVPNIISCEPWPPRVIAREELS